MAKNNEVEMPDSFELDDDFQDEASKPSIDYKKYVKSVKTKGSYTADDEKSLVHVNMSTDCGMYFPGMNHNGNPVMIKLVFGMKSGADLSNMQQPEKSHLLENQL